MKDLATFDALAEAQETGIAVVIKDPKGHEIGFTIIVAGPDSQRAKAELDALRQERISAEDQRPITPAEIEANALRVLAACTVSWDPELARVGDQGMPCNRMNAITIYQRFPFIRDQVQAKAQNRASFINGSE